MKITTKELKELLSEDDIKNILESLDGEVSYENDDYWISNTVCHCGAKHKLYYYKESKSFYCYTNCGSMDIFSVISNHFDYDLDEFPKVVEYISKVTGISLEKTGFGNQTRQNKLSDFAFIKRFKMMSNKTSRKLKTTDDIKVYDESILKTFQQCYYSDWIREGISIASMKKYEILYSANSQAIIIPHRNISNQLIGVRCRNLSEEMIESCGKYTPFKSGIFYNHPLGKNLYGLYLTKTGISKRRKLCIVEAEKSVMQSDTMFGEDNFTVAVCGSSISDIQKEIIINKIIDYQIREIIIAFDKQYQTVGDDEYNEWVTKINKQIGCLRNYAKVSVILDTHNLLDYKDSPTDKGKDVFLKLYQDRIFI